MSLKDKINETKTIKPKIETELNKINSVITEGGGIVSNTLSEISNNITTMVTSNYKKIAVLDFSSNPTNIIGNTKLNYSLNFEPKILIITIADNPDISQYSTNILSVVTPSQINGSLGKIHYVRDPNTAFCIYTITNFNKNELTWEESYRTGCYYLMITHIIAIG